MTIYSKAFRDAQGMISASGGSVPSATTTTKGLSVSSAKKQIKFAGSPPAFGMGSYAQVCDLPTLAGAGTIEVLMDIEI